MTAETTSDKDARNHRIKRLIYRASYTGMKETDLLLGQFAKCYLPDSSDAELDEFQALLDAGDPNIFAWVRGIASRQPIWTGWFWHRLKNFSQNFNLLI